jgi:Mg2+-importing ATPase
VRTWNWASWLLGAALLAAVIYFALHFSEGRDFLALTQRAQPQWLAVAFLLQAATYVAQAEVFRDAPLRAGFPLSRVWLSELSVTKLFLDQALPSAGISSTVVVTRALQQAGVPRGIAAAGALVNIASYNAAYVVALFAALAITVFDREANPIVVVASVLFVVFAIAMTAVVLALAGRRSRRLTALARFPILKGLLGFMEDADARLIRSVPIMLDAVAWQIAIVLLDAATMWVLLLAIGAPSAVTGVYASYMISSLFRTVGVVPGGLGTYEATSVLTLRLIGVNLPAALSATLLFRGLSFWLPMLPGLWFSRRTLARGVDARAFGDAGAYWTLEAPAVAARLGSSADGLSQDEAEARLEAAGPNALRARPAATRWRIFVAQVRSPLLLILVFAAVISLLTGQWSDAAIVLVIVFASVAIGYARESDAHAAVHALQARIRTHATAVRDGRPVQMPLDALVPGDVVLLEAGQLVPADAVLLEASDFFVSEAVLTGESFPVAKAPGVAAEQAPLADRANCVFLGSNVRSGTARCLVVRTGAGTEFWSVAARLAARPPDTSFDRGIRRFGYLLTITMLVLVLAVFAVHVLRGRPPVETLLFSVALAVGLSPELLPAVLTVNLARGARMMVQHGVLVRRLPAIEDLGSVDVLCTDKTGTLTEGVVKLEGAYDASGAPAPRVLALAATAAALETGLSNPLDEAIAAAGTRAPAGTRKIAEIPFDASRRRSSVVVDDGGRATLLTKGAFAHVADACSTVSGRPLDEAARADLVARFEGWTRQGIRVLAVASRPIAPKPAYDRDDEQGLAFEGFLTFLDNPKPDVTDTIRDLARLGVSVKVITGDSALVAQHVAGLVGLRAERLLTGRELLDMRDEALWHEAERTDLFAEVDPQQKERIIRALKHTGHVVGFLGDGVNDAPAMHAADTSLAVEQAGDVAREAADFVLLERSLAVIRRGIEEGRRTFANTQKYILTTTSANLGNMVSMAAASLVLPFLPLTAGQILLNNFLSDVPAVGIADDAVDAEIVERPERWNVRRVGRFMVVFGLLSSSFDALTFGVLLRGFHAVPDLFRTGWFVESLLTELVIALVVRTRRPFYRSRPGRLLLGSTVALVPVALLLPYVPFAGALGFVPLPLPLVATICAIAALYVAAAERAKRWFFRRT